MGAEMLLSNLLLPVQAGVLNVTNHYEQSILHAGDAGFAPMSSAHYFKNIGTTDCYVVLIFNAGTFTNIDATFLIGNMPAEVSRHSFSELICISIQCRWSSHRAIMFSLRGHLENFARRVF